MKSKFQLPLILVALLVILLWCHYSGRIDELSVESPPSVAETATNQSSPSTNSDSPPKVDFGTVAHKLSQDKEPLVPIYLGDKSFRVTIADSRAEWIKGLSGSPRLPFGEGKLFIFDESGKYGIWMKDMLFAIDIIWLNEAGKIVYIAPNIVPESFPEVFRPSKEARFVLEVPAGTVSDTGLSLNDQMVIDSFYLPEDLRR